jgi:hypothetical protein
VSSSTRPGPCMTPSSVMWFITTILMTLLPRRRYGWSVSSYSDVRQREK